MSNKGQTGLQFALGVLVILTAFVFIFAAGAYGLVTLRDIMDTVDFYSVPFTNITTLTTVNETGSNVTGTTNLRECSLTVTAVMNASGSLIPATNYTISNCQIRKSGLGDYGNSTIWTVNGTYSFSGGTQTNVTSNFIIAGSSFAGNSTQIMQLVLLIVILTLLSFAIFAIYKFAVGNVEASGSGSSSGSSASIGNGGFKFGGSSGSDSSLSGM